jgi:carboxypeptidase Taq
VKPESDAYQTLLDEYEEGVDPVWLNTVFSELETGLHKLLPSILEAQARAASASVVTKGLTLDTLPVSRETLLQLLQTIGEAVGFSFAEGNIATVAHPFCIDIGHHDTRLTTTIAPNQMSFAIMGFIHELGHGMYEQHTDESLVSHGLAHGASLGVHESQSRFLENMIGRTEAFWQYFMSVIHQRHPELQSKLPPVTALVRSLNHVKPSLVRVDADEVTYNLHILLRYRIEQEIFQEKLATKNIAERWNALSQELFGLTPQHPVEGYGQDVHWSWGNFGYFPTYTIGNLLAARLLERFTADHPQWRTEVSQGNFTSYAQWFLTHVWKYGASLPPQQLIAEISGKPLTARPLLTYLSQKYLAA